MASYTYTANSSSQQSANIATDKIRIATTTSAIHFATGSANVAGTGTITANTASNVITGSGTSFTTQVSVGNWIVSQDNTVVWGEVASIANNTSLTFVANSSANTSGGSFSIAPTSAGFAVATANSEIIPAGSTERSIIVGQGNVVAFLNVAGTAGGFSITELGMPHGNTGT
jgi:hypothetical protein